MKGVSVIMVKFTCIMLKEVVSYLREEDDLDKLVDEMGNKSPLLCFYVTGHLLANEVADLEEIHDVIKKTYVTKTYLVEINMLEYLDGDDDVDSQEELDYVRDNLDMLIEDEKIDLINTDYFTMSITDNGM